MQDPQLWKPDFVLYSLRLRPGNKPQLPQSEINLPQTFVIQLLALASTLLGTLAPLAFFQFFQGASSLLQGFERALPSVVNAPAHPQMHDPGSTFVFFPTALPRPQHGA